MPRPILARAVDTAMDRSVVLGYTTIGLAVRRALPGWPADPLPRSLEGRHVLVTGASSGLGAATVEGLAGLGAVVHLLVRDEAKGAGVADRIRAAHPGAELRLWRCDVADLDDVRRFATDFAAEVPDLHAVVHNAGVMPPERTESPQGLELSMAVHLVGPVVMTEALRGPLAGGRVVLVSSGGMYGQPLHADDPGYTAGDYSPTTSYARSKRWQVELAPLLADRWGADGITVATMHPGWADTPGVRESLPTLPTAHPAGAARRRAGCRHERVADGGRARPADRSLLARPGRAPDPPAADDARERPRPGPCLGLAVRGGRAGRRRTLGWRGC